MTLSPPAPRPTRTAADRQPGPNQWIKDHLDSVIDAELLKDWPAVAAEADSGKGPRP
ncbi:MULTISPECIES: hypothetical protein [unclassified Streptomyces]|uniref:hypothetical protein n=1 Tax=unclassified Streptomyces TaxID=2593676 RepID=UPI00365B5D18